jgi:hypothetical protein
VNCTDVAGGLLADYRSLIVIVRATASMAPQINGIVAAIDQIKAMFDNSAIDVFRSYLLITFANNGTC